MYSICSKLDEIVVYAKKRERLRKQTLIQKRTKLHSEIRFCDSVPPGCRQFYSKMNNPCFRMKGSRKALLMKGGGLELRTVVKTRIKVLSERKVE